MGRPRKEDTKVYGYRASDRLMKDLMLIAKLKRRSVANLVQMILEREVERFKKE